MKSSQSHGLTCDYKVETQDLVARVRIGIYYQMTHDSSHDEKDGCEGGGMATGQRHRETQKMAMKTRLLQIIRKGNHQILLADT